MLHPCQSGCTSTVFLLDIGIKLVLLHRLHPKIRTKTVFPIARTFSVHLCPRPKDGDLGKPCGFPKKCFCILFAPKSMGQSRLKRHAAFLPERLYVYSNSILISVSSLFFYIACTPIQTQNSLPKARAFSVHLCPRPKDGDLGKPCGFPKKCFCILFAPKSMGQSRPERQVTLLPERLHVYRIFIGYRYQACSSASLAPQYRPKTILPKGQAFSVHLCPRPKDGGGETMWFSQEMFLHTFCAKKYGPVAARATGYPLAGAAVRLL